MPELPEVETIKRILGPQLRGLKIENVIVNQESVIAHPAMALFCDKVSSQIIDRLERRGKFLCIDLRSGDMIIIHLRMTGCLLVVDPATEAEKHTHVIFRLRDAKQGHGSQELAKQGHDVCKELRFSDPRRFGRLWLIDSEEEDIYSGMYKLGPEFFDAEFGDEYLRQQCGRRKKAIKSCLLDQNIIAGLGNIYCDEILWAAKIHPQRPAKTLSAGEWRRLAELIPERLSFFIETNAISPQDYLQSKGKEYRNTPYIQIYGHAGEPCPKCGTVLCKTVVGGRSSVFCSNCQKEKLDQKETEKIL